MTLIDAAERVLRVTGRPMHSTEIIAYARRRGWITTGGKTPDHSLQAAIWKSMKQLGTRSPFAMVGRGTRYKKYSLRY